MDIVILFLIYWKKGQILKLPTDMAIRALWSHAISKLSWQTFKSLINFYKTFAYFLFSRGHAKCVDLLLGQKELDIDRRSNKGTTALHDAAESNNVQIFEKLLSRGSRFLRNELNVSPLLTGMVLIQLDFKNKFEIK